MFDKGNRLFVRSGGEYNGGQTTISASDGGLSYHPSCGAELQPTNVGDIQYSACLEDTLFAGVFSSATSAIGGFRVEGDLGADGRGDLHGNNASLSSGRLHGFYKSVHSAYSGNGFEYAHPRRVSPPPPPQILSLAPSQVHRQQHQPPDHHHHPGRAPHLGHVRPFRPR